MIKTTPRIISSACSRRLTHVRRLSRAQYSSNASSVSADEISHFDKLAATWWDLNGSSRLLHKMNPARISFIKSHVLANSFPPSSPSQWLAGTKTLDVGCGGGILSEALARVGGTVTGLDASSAGITVAQTHARQMGLEVEYVHDSAESLLIKRPESYELVCAMEILEHVASPPRFLATLLGLLQEDGLLVISTIEKSTFAKFLTCTLAENVLGLVPRGTHNADKFIPKRAMEQWTQELGAQVVDTRGIIFDPLAGTWRVLSKNQPWGEACNYIMAIRKTKRPAAKR